MSLWRLPVLWVLVLSTAILWAAVPNSPRIDTVQVVADQGWVSDPHTIWYDNFEGSGALIDRYLEYDSNGGDFVPVTSEALGGAGKSMRTIFQAGEVVAGGLKVVFGRNPMDYRNKAVRKTEDFRDVYWRFYMKNQLGWTGNPAKVTRAIAFAGSDWSQAAFGHIWGGSGNSLAIDPASGVNSSSQVVTVGYNDFAHMTWLGAISSSYQLFSTAESGRWVCIEGHMKLNTAGQSDGIFTLYIDGQVQADHHDLNWVYSWHDYGINAVFLENYWNSGSSKLQERYFDDFVISTSYIGLVKSPTNPTVKKTAFSDPDSGDSQSAWQLQIAGTGTDAAIVWDSGTISGSGLSTVVNIGNGVFQGSLTGRTQLGGDKIYAARVRQRDAAGNWSAWSPWIYSIRTIATPPVANAGPDGIAYESRTCNLDGSASTNADTYAWTQLAGVHVTLQNANTAKPSFVVPTPANKTEAQLQFQLRVTNSSGSSSDSVNYRIRLLGDANGDDCVDSADRRVWLTNYDPLGVNQDTFEMGDFNGDGKIDSADRRIWLLNYNPLGLPSN